MKILLILIFTFINFQKAEASDQTGKVVDIRVSSQKLTGGYPTQVKLDSSWSGKPACATSEYWSIDTDTEAGKNMLSILLTALTTDNPVTIWGMAACNLRAEMEQALQVGLANKI